MADAQDNTATINKTCLCIPCKSATSLAVLFYGLYAVVVGVKLLVKQSRGCKKKKVRSFFFKSVFRV